MADVTFITGNQNKADKMAQYLDHPVAHHKLDLDEIQSLDPREVAEHKVRQAYDKLRKPVIVEDTFLVFAALGKLPGPYIKWFLEELGEQGTADLLKDKDRKAIAGTVFGYFDGSELKIFLGMVPGTIAEEASGTNGWAWDKIFIPAGYNVTRANMNDADYKKTYLKIKPFAELKKFLNSKHPSQKPKKQV